MWVSFALKPGIHEQGFARKVHPEGLREQRCSLMLRGEVEFVDVQVLLIEVKGRAPAQRGNVEDVLSVL